MEKQSRDLSVLMDKKMDEKFEAFALGPLRVAFNNLEDSMNERFDKAEKNIFEIKKDVFDITRDIAEIKEKLNKLENKLSELEEKIHVLNGFYTTTSRQVKAVSKENKIIKKALEKHSIRMPKLVGAN